MYEKRRFGQGLATLWDEGLALLFPPRCAGCHCLSEELFCAACRAAARFITKPVCFRCGRPLPPGVVSASDCARCRGTCWQLTAIRACAEFDTGVREAVHRLKYQQAGYAAPLFASWMVRSMAEHDDLPWDDGVLVPVPLHWMRRRRRGYNQSELIARALGAASGYAVQPRLLRRRRYTPPQTSLDSAARRTNVRDAFIACPMRTGLPRRVILVDDVATTGATLNACAAALRRCGVEEILALVVAT